ncbi:aldo/keto reductase [Frankia sp. AvcI1]|uniref:aldo/keto reductase n=1 Tax=Frankia sp. AvcI1 TaxID=573496 RepID=UPI002117A794|nr:aldo/keto reductase [Frankia sp. AvcI1]
MDTGYNYFGYASHRNLGRLPEYLLQEFTLSTKVGFFPGLGGTEHSLEIGRLRNAIEKSTDDLGRASDVIFLHNPERSLAGLSPDEGYDRLIGASTVLVEAVKAGFCRSWGIASWDPRTLLRVLARAAVGTIPTPCTLMVRAGLLTESSILDAGEQVGAIFGLGSDSLWGMSPFGGSTTNPVWNAVNTRIFLAPNQESNHVQAAFRVAYELPRVSRIAVSTNRIEHLNDLVKATALDVDSDVIARYRSLLRTRSVTS